MPNDSTAAEEAPKPEATPPEDHNGTSLKPLKQAAEFLRYLLRVLRYGYLLRVPILIALLPLLFPFAALLPHSPVRALFQNLFLLDEGNGIWPWPTFWSTMAALVLAWSVLLTLRIVLLNCKAALPFLPG